MTRSASKSAPKSAIGIRELKNHTSAVIRRVRRGETITVKDRSEPVALLVPITAHDEEATVRQLVQSGRLSWSGGKPSGVQKPPAVRGPTVADAVVEDRR